MLVVAYHENQVDRLTAIYNDLTQSVPHCYPIEASELADAFAGKCGLESDGKRLTAETVLVAKDADALQGFVHVGEGFTKETECEAGVIRFLAYPRGRRDVGQALLDASEDWLRQRGQAAVIVFPQTYRYFFYSFAHAFISNRLDHVQALLLFNGYQTSNGEVFLDWPDFDPRYPAEIVDGKFGEFVLTVNRSPSPGRLPDLAVKAYHGKQHVGTCELLNGRAFSQHQELDSWVFCMWLGVDDPFQGSGLGRTLLAHALFEAKSAGYRHAAISTARDNYRAQLFYSNHGFHAVDWTYQYRKTLSN